VQFHLQLVHHAAVRIGRHVRRDLPRVAVVDPPTQGPQVGEGRDLRQRRAGVGGRHRAAGPHPVRDPATRVAGSMQETGPLGRGERRLPLRATQELPVRFARPLHGEPGRVVGVAHAYRERGRLPGAGRVVEETVVLVQESHAAESGDHRSPGVAVGQEEFAFDFHALCERLGGGSAVRPIRGKPLCRRAWSRNPADGLPRSGSSGISATPSEDSVDRTDGARVSVPIRRRDPKSSRAPWSRDRPRRTVRGD